MNYIKLVPTAIFYLSLYLMPAWIIGVSETTWPSPTKRVTIIVMAISSTLFTVVVIAKPHTDSTTRIIGNIVAIAYLLIVFAVTLYSWRKLR